MYGPSLQGMQVSSPAHRFWKGCGEGIPTSFLSLCYDFECPVQGTVWRILFVTGHSAIPRQLFWMRKAAAGGIAEASSQVTLIEKVVQQGCNYCITNAKNCDGKLKCCSRCKSAWYCGKICQTNAWKDGYKVDCVKYN